MLVGESLGAPGTKVDLGDNQGGGVQVGQEDLPKEVDNREDDSPADWDYRDDLVDSGCPAGQDGSGCRVGQGDLGYLAYLDGYLDDLANLGDQADRDQVDLEFQEGYLVDLHRLGDYHCRADLRFQAECLGLLVE